MAVKLFVMLVYFLYWTSQKTGRSIFS